MGFVPAPSRVLAGSLAFRAYRDTVLTTAFTGNTIIMRIFRPCIIVSNSRIPEGSHGEDKSISGLYGGSDHNLVLLTYPKSDKGHMTDNQVRAVLKGFACFVQYFHSL